MAQMVQAWSLRRPEVASPNIRASRPEQVANNLRAAGVSLQAELLANR